MCNRKTKQWHMKPTLAEYKTMNVYCIVNELKTVSKWDKMTEVTTKVLTELTADLWLWSCEGMREGVSRWAGDPLPLEICHIWYWAVMGDLLKCSDVVGLCAQTVSTTKLKFVRNQKLKVTCSWAFTCTVMPVFFLKWKQTNRCGGGARGRGGRGRLGH